MGLFAISMAMTAEFRTPAGMIPSPTVIVEVTASAVAVVAVAVVAIPPAK